MFENTESFFVGGYSNSVFELEFKLVESIVSMTIIGNGVSQLEFKYTIDSYLSSKSLIVYVLNLFMCSNI